MIKAILVDDERKSILTLQKLLEKYCTDFKVLGTADNVHDAVKIINEKEPDVIFLDIEMTDGTGFDLLKKFDNPFFRFVFVTAYSRYAVKAFRYSAIDYLLKPVDVDDLKVAAEKIRNSVENGIILKQHRSVKGKMLRLRSKKDFLHVSSDQIIRLKAFGSYTKIMMLNNEEHLLPYNLGTLEKKLNDNNFVRVHRSETININYIVRIIKTQTLHAELVGGHMVEISRRSKIFLFNLIEERGKNDHL